MRTPDQYLSSLRDGRAVYYGGKKVEDVTTHPVLRVAVSHASRLYELRSDARLREILVYHDEGMGTMSSFFKVPRSVEDLLLRSIAIQETTRSSNGVFNIIQVIGSDALFALMIVAKKIWDEVRKAEYYERVLRYYEYVASNDLAIATAQTDVKGDRTKRPHEQSDPDMYLRVVDVTDEGIVVNGAKAHTTQSVVANEVIFLPSRALGELDRDYAVAFALPASTKGLKLIARPLMEVEGVPSEEDAPLSSRGAEVESLTVLDHVMVPWERVFLFKEWKYAGELANLFATFHRFSAISYRCVVADLYLGAARLAAKANGIEEVPHVRDGVLEIVLYKEIMNMALRMSAIDGVLDVGTKIIVPNPISTNVGKLYSNTNFANVVRNVIDIAGGYVSTLPSTLDLENPETGQYIEKFLGRGSGYEGAERYKVLRLVRELVGGPLAGYMLGLMIHAEGSAAASRIALYRSYEFDEAERLALEAARLIK
ncbi:MAG: 4-hydroxybutyryl-CoA dehydratase [Aigarchaeota archaeon]|nr:4-hydroxybutyryl-CoA dehydratase [Aigarchaeota archaeon]MDW8092730.1 4-hydroxyphenylacetate 3-hydroxylase N-terminal domain-containing protein [Nitrososphaerota archaeon]